MNDIVQFQREEIQFSYNDEDFVYMFQRFDSGKFTMRRLLSATAPPQPEIGLHPNGDKPLISTAVIVLCKAAQSGQELKGHLPNVLRLMLDGYSARADLKSDLANAISSFPAKAPIATVDKVMEFAEPYAPWMVASLSIQTMSNKHANNRI
jgi:hypothetical protein